MSTIRSLARSGDVLRRVWRHWLRWRYRLFQRHRHDHLVLEEVAGLPILVLPGVFNPKLFWTGELMARTLDADLVPAGTAVLDMGTGSGIGAVAAARWAGRVVAVDINPAAVRCARINLILNGVEDRVVVHEGDLFGPVQGDRFDVVLFNPPYLPGTPATPLDRAFRGPDVARRFALGLGEHLAPGGHAILALSSVGDGPEYTAELDGAGFALEVVAERRLIGETLVVYRVRERN
jgi:release factor glutamine methyltransferase